MCNMNKIILAVALFIFFPFSILLAQDMVEKPKLKLAFQNKLGTEVLEQMSSTEDIYSNRKTPLLFGIYANYNKYEAEVDFFFNVLNCDFRYNIYRNFWVGISAGVSKHSLEMDEMYSDYYYDDYYDEDINYFKYTISAGYGKAFFRRLDLRANLSLGSLNSNKLEVSDYISTSSYYYSTNKKARVTETYQLNPSLIYGADISIALLPNPKKDRHYPVSPFFTLSFMGNSSSNTNRAVKVEEWVPGNVVYSETSGQSSLNYDIFSFKGCAGIRWFFNY